MPMNMHLLCASELEFIFKDTDAIEGLQLVLRYDVTFYYVLSWLHSLCPPRLQWEGRRRIHHWRVRQHPTGTIREDTELREPHRRQELRGRRLDTLRCSRLQRHGVRRVPPERLQDEAGRDGRHRRHPLCRRKDTHVRSHPADGEHGSLVCGGCVRLTSAKKYV